VDELILACRFLVSAVFLIAAFGKLSDLDGSRKAVQDFGVPTAFARPLGTLLPYLELGIGVALLTGTTYVLAALSAFVLSASLLVAVGVNLVAGRAPQCHCFGQIYSSPIGWKTVLQLLLLTVAAAVVAFHSERSDEFGLERMIVLVPPEQRAWLIGGICLICYSGFLTWIALNLRHQQERLVRRVDVLELQFFGKNGVQAKRAQGHLGLAVDANAPEFSLNDLNGLEVSLHGLLSQGSTVVAIFMDPDCDACDAMLPNVELWQKALLPATELIIISRGPVEQNIAKFGNRSIRNVLVERAREISNAFRCPGTPAAVWISADGRVASSLAMGPAAIGALVKAIQADDNPLPSVSLESARLLVQ
jgi:hypothetical protein